VRNGYRVLIVTYLFMSVLAQVLSMVFNHHRNVSIFLRGTGIGIPLGVILIVVTS
jgi:hypothetical protein